MADKPQKKRGAKRGGTTTPWTAGEWAVIHYAIDYGTSGTRAMDCEPFLPGRSRHNIHNALNLARRRKTGLCQRGCGQPKDPGHASCTACRTKARNRRKALIATGRCPCGDDIDQPGSSGTHCPRCRNKRKKYRPTTSKKFREQLKARPKAQARATATKSRRILPWPACGHVKWAAEIAAKTKRPVIDLFGGSGEPLRLVDMHGGDPHAYYDINPGLTAFVQACKFDDAISVVIQAIYGNDTSNPIVQTYLKARRGKPGAPKALRANMQLLGKALRNTIVECQDALYLLKDPLLRGFPPNAVLLVDPPWPGCDAQAQFGCPEPDFPARLDLLLDLPYEMDYILMLGSERAALKLASRHMRHAPLFWRAHGSNFAKSIVSLSPRLARQQGPTTLGIPISFEALGL